VKSVGAKPLGANKYPGGNQVNGAKKVVGGGVGAVKSVGGGAIKPLGGVTGGVVGGGQKALTGATSSLKGPISKPVNALPKPYPTGNTRSNSLPKPYPSSDKKSVVRPGQPKPFTPPVEQKKPDTKKAYPGTNTIPGQGSRVPVQNQKPKYKPLPRLGPQVGQGQTMTHLAV
jgi:hypothetical protein